MASSFKLKFCHACQILSLSRLYPFVSSFFIFYLILILLSPVLILLLLYRLILSLIFKIIYENKYRLISGVDSVYVADRHANLPVITVFLYVQGECDIDKIRQRISEALLSRNEHGRRPFGLLLHSVTEKFGLVCWEDKGESVDFSHHVRLCPGASDPEQTYSEVEVLDAVAKCSDSLWAENRPRWEILVTPQVSREQCPDQVYHSLAVKIHHAYVDGVSFLQVLRHCVADEPPPPFYFDPVDPPIKPIPFYKKVILYLRCFFLGPHATLKMAGREQDPVFSMGSLDGSKFYGRTKKNPMVSLDDVRCVRKSYNCSTQAIFHSCLLGALRKMTVKKGIQVPQEIVAGVNFSDFPYPDESPRNRAVFSMEQVEIGIADPVARLASINLSMKKLTGQADYTLAASRLLTRLVGLFPKWVLISSMEALKVPYILSNVPGFSKILMVNGKNVDVKFGLPPLMNATRLSVGIGYYAGQVSGGFAIAKTKIISNRREAEELIGEFEDELVYLVQQANYNIIKDSAEKL